MKVTAIIPDDLIDSVKEITGEKTRTKAVIIALENFIKRKNSSDLIEELKTEK